MNPDLVLPVTILAATALLAAIIGFGAWYERQIGRVSKLALAMEAERLRMEQDAEARFQRSKAAIESVRDVALHSADVTFDGMKRRSMLGTFQPRTRKRTYVPTQYDIDRVTARFGQVPR